MSLPIGQQTVLLGSNQQLGPCKIFQRQLKQLVDIRFAVTHTHDHRVGTLPLSITSSFKTLQPLDALLLLDGLLFALMVFAKRAAVPCPALHIDQSQWLSLLRKVHRVVHYQPNRSIFTGADRSHSIRL